MPFPVEPFTPALHPPFLTADLPGIGGRIKEKPEDFEVEEIPAYLPSGDGDYLYLWIEKSGMGAQYFQRQVAQRLGIPPGEVGSAGLKDRHAVTRQWISVPGSCEERLAQLEGDGIRVLKMDRHSNKLKPGHLHGNRFCILIRDAQGDARPILHALRQQGVPNFYGTQRFGREGETLQTGLDLLSGDAKVRNPFLKKLSLSAVQSALFNLYLAERMRDGLLHSVLLGDVMCKVPRGGMFVTSDPPTEQTRLNQREIVSAGPIFGAKMYLAAGDAREREDRLLSSTGMSASTFGPVKKLMPGTRRHNLVFLDDLSGELEAEGWRLTFSLPAGSYATVVMRELMKVEVQGEE